MFCSQDIGGTLTDDDAGRWPPWHVRWGWDRVRIGRKPVRRFPGSPDLYQSALLDSALGTALALIDVGDDAEPVRGSV